MELSKCDIPKGQRICDFCSYFSVFKDEDGMIIDGDGHCRKHNATKFIADYCQMYKCKSCNRESGE